MSVFTQPDWAELIPHSGSMRLLDTVIAWNLATIHAASDRHALTNHPLGSHKGLHAVHLAEYGAQAAAVHGALLASSKGDARMRPGRLVSLRDVHLAVEYVDLPKGRLDVHAECLYADESGAQYTFKIEQGGCLLASGRAVVMHTDA